uniref:Uncharacterized protein n=1 Tax=Glossina austeni TaxID=7395 RepID=A0A1A9UX14_GLOAU
MASKRQCQAVYTQPNGGSEEQIRPRWIVWKTALVKFAKRPRQDGVKEATKGNGRSASERAEEFITRMMAALTIYSTGTCVFTCVIVFSDLLPTRHPHYQSPLASSTTSFIYQPKWRFCFPDNVSPIWKCQA